MAGAYHETRPCPSWTICNESRCAFFEDRKCLPGDLRFVDPCPSEHFSLLRATFPDTRGIEHAGIHFLEGSV